MNNSEIIWTLIGIIFSTYFIVSFVFNKLGIQNLHKALISANGLRLLNLKHLLGIVLFGVFSYIMMPEFRVLIETIEIAKLVVLIAFFLILFLSAFVSYLSIQKREEIHKVHISHYSFSNAWMYFIIRFTFLLCYEFFFRGVLLFKFLNETSLFLAIFYSTTFYVLIHIFDSKKEIIGAIPFGIVLCLFTYYTNSVWYAFLIHLALSSVYEISMFYYLTLKNKIIS
jgi:membrane protease YdiL (CAAX protease family)